MNVKILGGIIFIVLTVGCVSSKNEHTSSTLRSEREYRVGSEALAQDLYKTGQAPNIQQARAEAAAAANEEWARAAKAAKKNGAQKEFERKLKKNFPEESR